MWIKLLVVICLFLILFNLFRALPVMLKGQSDQSMAKHLGRRVFFSAFLLFMVFLALASGLITPNSAPF